MIPAPSRSSRRFQQLQHIHGLVVASDVVLPGIPRSADCPPDIELFSEIHLAPPQLPAVVLYESAALGGSAPSVRIVRDVRNVVCFRYRDGTAFDVASPVERTRISVVIAPGQTLEDMAAYLYGPVMGYVLRARGVLALHAACVEIDGRAVLLAGHQGAGKSTLAAAFAQQGYRVLSDDLTALTRADGGYVAHPAFNHVRLWPSSEPLLFGRDNVLPTITPTWDKRRLPLGEASFGSSRARLGAIYVMQRNEQDLHPAPIRQLAGAEALLALTATTYCNYLLDAPMRAQEFHELGALLRSVPVRRLAPPRGTRLPPNEMTRILLEDVRPLHPTVAAAR